MQIVRYFWIVMLLGISPSFATASQGWQRFYNAETGLAVDIPTAIFAADAGSPEGGSGRKFLTADGGANLTVQSLPNEGRLSPAAFLRSKNPPAGLVYRRVTANFFVVSSFRNDMIFYNRCNFKRRLANCVFVNYPASQKRQWDGVVTRISRSLML